MKSENCVESLGAIYINHSCWIINNKDSSLVVGRKLKLNEVKNLIKLLSFCEEHRTQNRTDLTSFLQ